MRIGTRGSALALAQAHEVRRLLASANGLDPESIEIQIISTTGDRTQDRPLAEAGGKGLFTKEIEEALLQDKIDLAVHSAKDMPTWLPDGLTLAAYPQREDVRDVLIGRNAGKLEDLPAGAVVGTASLRRQAQVLRLRPDLRVVSFRGNVETRLRKLSAGDVDATLLALAGLRRLGKADVAGSVLSIQDFLPAVGQGAVAIEIRAEDTRTRGMVDPLNDPATAIAVTAERAFLAALEGSCRTPIAGFAQVSGRGVHFRGMIIRPDGSEAYETEREGSADEASALGADAGRELKERMPPDFFLPR